MKKMNIKKGLALILILAVFSLMTGCGGKETAADESKDKAATEETAADENTALSEEETQTQTEAELTEAASEEKAEDKESGSSGTEKSAADKSSAGKGKTSSSTSSTAAAKDSSKPASSAKSSSSSGTSAKKSSSTKSSSKSTGSTKSSSEKSTSSAATESSAQLSKADPKTCTHDRPTGNSGMWFDTKDEADAYDTTELRYWADICDRELISYDDYCKKCPFGYSLNKCALCGRYTLSFFFDDDGDGTGGDFHAPYPHIY